MHIVASEKNVICNCNLPQIITELNESSRITYKQTHSQASVKEYEYTC